MTAKRLMNAEDDLKVENNFMQKSYYEKLKFKLYQTSCLDILAELPENSVDMVFADPALSSIKWRFYCSRWTAS